MNHQFLFIGLILAMGTQHVTADEFESIVAPFLKQHCVRCHGAAKAEAKLSLHKITSKVGPSDTKVWEAVLMQVSKNAMPPKDEPRPEPSQKASVIHWIRDTLQSASKTLAPHEMIYPENGNHVPHELLFTKNPDAKPATPARIWRVRPSIYESFVEQASREPFHHPFRRESLYSTPWGLDGKGFKDYSALYWIGEAETELLIGNAMRAAEMMSRKRGKFGGEAKVFRDFLISRRDVSKEQTEQVIVTAFRQILKREPKGEEQQRYSEFLSRNVEQLGREKGLQTTLAALLLHPRALFRFELGQGDSDKARRIRLAPTELAYAIAYTLTDSAPDELLLQAAKMGSLTDGTSLRKHVLRLMDAEQAKMQASYRKAGVGRRHTAPLLRFFQEYFGYTTAPQVFKDQATKREARLAGSYSPEALVSDTNLLVLYCLEQDEEVLKRLLTTELSFVSTGRGRWNGLVELKKRAKKEGRTKKVTPFDDRRNRINEHYNITPEQWSEEMPFPLDETQRAGILTQPAWLIAHSTNFENHAIHRGKWIRERLLGGTIPETPITVDAQLPDEESMTLRERMHVTRDAFCWKCHQKMDPLGLPFEMFDHFGRFRTQELGKPINASGVLAVPGEPELEGPVENAIDLMHKLGSSKRVRQVFVRHAFRFFMGRNETIQDAPTLIEADRVYTESGGSMRQLVASLISSDSFIYRSPIPRKNDRSGQTSKTDPQPPQTGNTVSRRIDP